MVSFVVMSCVASFDVWALFGCLCVVMFCVLLVTVDRGSGAYPDPGPRPSLSISCCLDVVLLLLVLSCCVALRKNELGVFRFAVPRL